MTPEICLALTIYFEARAEPELGQRAVAHVVMNRVIQNQSDICKEVFRPFQFSWSKDFRTGKTKVTNWSSYNDSLEIAKDVIDGNVSDPTKGSTHFHNNEVKPSWSEKFRKMIRIGNHTFYKQQKQSKRK